MLNSIILRTNNVLEYLNININTRNKSTTSSEHSNTTNTTTKPVFLASNVAEFAYDKNNLMAITHDEHILYFVCTNNTWIFKHKKKLPISVNKIFCLWYEFYFSTKYGTFYGLESMTETEITLKKIFKYRSQIKKIVASDCRIYILGIDGKISYYYKPMFHRMRIFYLAHVEQTEIAVKNTIKNIYCADNLLYAITTQNSLYTIETGEPSGDTITEICAIQSNIKGIYSFNQMTFVITENQTSIFDQKKGNFHKFNINLCPKHIFNIINDDLLIMLDQETFGLFNLTQEEIVWVYRITNSTNSIRQINNRQMALSWTTIEKQIIRFLLCVRRRNLPKFIKIRIINELCAIQFMNQVNGQFGENESNDKSMIISLTNKFNYFKSYVMSFLKD